MDVMMKDMQVAIYARVSSERQASDGTISSQIEALEERLDQDGLSIESELRFIDDGYSGSTLVRPGMERLRDIAASGAIDRIYIHSPDRLARKYAYQVLLVDEFQRCGVEVIFLNCKLGKTPEDELLLQVQGMVAEYERAKIMERSRRGKLHSARCGKVNAMSNAPYGYRYLRRGENGGDAQYQIILEEAEVVRQVFEWIVLGRLSISEVCNRLSKQGVITQTGNKRWSRSTINKMLANPAYKGLAAFGRTRTGKKRPRLRPYRGACDHPRRAGSSYNVPSEKWINIPVPAIISEELFDAAKEQLAENKKRHRQGSRGAMYLLQGLLVCKQCGYAYHGKSANVSARKNKQHPSGLYRCGGTDAHRFGGHQVCWNESIRIKELDDAVWKDLCSLLSDPKRIEQEYSRRLTVRKKSVGWNSIEQVQLLISKVKRGIARLIDAYEGGLLEKNEFTPRIQKARQRLEKLNAESQTRTDEQTQKDGLRLLVTRMQDFAKKVVDGLDKADWLTRQNLLRTLIRQVEVDKKEILIVYKISPILYGSDPKQGSRQDCPRHVDTMAPDFCEKTRLSH